MHKLLITKMDALSVEFSSEFSSGKTLDTKHRHWYVEKVKWLDESSSTIPSTSR